MIEVSMWRGPLHDHLVVYATRAQVAQLRESMRPNDVYRFRHALEDLRAVEPAAYPTSTTVIDLSRPEAHLFKAMDPKSCRYEIRRAEKIADRITTRSDSGCHDDFRLLYNEFAATKGYARPLSARRYARYLEAAEVFVAYLDGAPVVGHLLLCDGDTGRARLIFSASRRLTEEYRSVAGPINRYLHWVEIRAYKERGYGYYDFGGISSTPGSIGKFKLSFGGDVETGYDLVLQRAPARVPVRMAESALRLRRRLLTSRRQSG